MGACQRHRGSFERAYQIWINFEDQNKKLYSWIIPHRIKLESMSSYQYKWISELNVEKGLFFF